MEFTKDINFNINPTVNQDLTITYNGFLNNSQEVSLVYGYGDSWENTSEIKMKKNENGFVGTVNLLDYDTFNFCFKNSNGDWDNNSYCNYITSIAPEVNQANNFDIDSLIEELLFEPIVNIQNTDEENLILEPTITEEISLGDNLVLESIANNEVTQNTDQISSKEDNLDLGYQLSTLLSKAPESNIEFEEYSTLDEILTAQKIENDTSVEFLQDISVLDFEENYVSSQNYIEEYNEVYDNFVNNIEYNANQIQTANNNSIQEYTEVFDDFINNISFITNTSQSVNTVHQNTQQDVEPQTYNTTVEENNAIFEDFINNLSSITSKHQNIEKNYNNIEQQNINNEKALTTIYDSYIVSSRQASKFYLFRKRIKLALYKALVKLPKMLLGIEDKEN